MKRLAILAATSVLALSLTACGDHKKEETTQAPTEAMQTAAPAEEQQAQPAAEAQPAEAAPAAEEGQH